MIGQNYFFGDTSTTSIETAEDAAIAAALAAQSTGTPTPKLQGMGPTIIATTQDSKYAYVGFNLSDTIAKVRLADLAIEVMAALSQYFPLQCYRMASDASAITNAGRLLIAQGEQVLEADGTNMHLIASHPLLPNNRFVCILSFPEGQSTRLRQ